MRIGTYRACYVPREMIELLTWPEMTTYGCCVETVHWNYQKRAVKCLEKKFPIRVTLQVYIMWS